MNLARLFQISGRAGREEFACISLLVLALTMGLSFVGVWILLQIDEMTLLKAIFVIILGLLTFPLSILLAWVSIATFVRRLHDLNWSGGWYVGYLVMVTLGAFVLPQLQGVFSVLGAALIVFLSAKSSPSAPNRFAEQAAPFFPSFFSNHKWVLPVVVVLTVLCAVVPSWLFTGLSKGL